jgi:hypothetical protein
LIFFKYFFTVVGKKIEKKPRKKKMKSVKALISIDHSLNQVLFTVPNCLDENSYILITMINNKKIISSFDYLIEDRKNIKIVDGLSTGGNLIVKDNIIQLSIDKSLTENLFCSVPLEDISCQFLIKKTILQK